MFQRMRKPMARPRRASGGRIRNLPIQSKIFTLISVPLTTLGVIGLIAIGASSLNATRGAAVEQVAQVAPALTGLVDGLQQERRLAAEHVGGGRAGNPDALRGQYKVVDQRRATLQAQVDQLAATVGGEGFRALSDALGRSSLDNLALTRERVESDRTLTPEATADLYTPLTTELIGTGAELGTGADDERLLRASSTATALARAKDAAAQEQALVGAAITAGRVAPQQAERLLRLAAAQNFWLTQARTDATPGQQELLEEVGTHQATAQAARLRDQVAGSAGGPVRVDPRAWAAASDEQLERLGQAEQRLAADVAAAGEAFATAAENQVVASSVALTVVLAVSVVVSLLIGRSLIRPIERLSATARRVAHERIPGVVARMERAEVVDLEQEAEPSGITSQDEIGALAGAFDTVHQVAVRIAAEQSALRRSVSDMILNLARRSQALTDRLLEQITDLERDEADPATLEKLFQLDHLATRMRRTAENLVVFSGSEPTRRWSEPVPLPDVVEAAVAEAEDYARVQLLGIDEVQVQGRAASDVTHLLAELIDNATSFSPPTAPVSIAGQFVGRGYLIEIEDRGIGMAAEDLEKANRRLAEPPVFDFSVRQRLGLFVVGRLAGRYGMKVQLRPSVTGGVTALVMLPGDLLTGHPEEAGAGAGGPVLVGAASTAARRPPLTAPAAGVVVPARAQAAAAVPLPIFEETRADWAAGLPPGLTARASASGGGRTGSGLPRRTPNANYPAGRTAPPGGGPLDDGSPGGTAPGNGPPGDGPPGSPGPRPPEQVRDLLSSFQHGIAQGRGETGHDVGVDHTVDPAGTVWEPRPRRPRPAGPFPPDRGAGT